MRQLQLITFKGCQSTIDFRNKLEDLIDKENLDVKVEMVIVPSKGKAKEMRLFGSPTIMVDEVEYQKERQGPPGFY